MITVCEHEPDVRSDNMAWAAWAFAGPQTLCPWGNCTEDLCAECGRRTHNGYGPLFCPCDATGGWNGPRIDNMSKPHPPIKAKGRHGGHIQRAQREHRRRLAWMRQGEQLVESLQRGLAQSAAGDTVYLGEFQ